MKPSKFFVLGNTPHLSLAELQATLADPTIELFNQKIAVSSSTSVGQATDLINLLGGTVKILQPLAEAESNPIKLESQLAQILTKLSAGTRKIIFNIGLIGPSDQDEPNLVHIKSILAKSDIKTRFITGSKSGLSAAVLLHQPKVMELVIVYSANSAWITQTQAIQNIDDWTKRDRSRPYAQSQAGMLPLKVARMMVNLAIGENSNDQKTLLDPFCGAGSVLSEAMLLGVNVIGNDQQQRAVIGCQQNLRWLKNEYHLTPEFEVHNQDATSLKLLKPVDYLVTEPFLGKPQPQNPKVDNIQRGLYKLYWGAFRHWRQILKPGAKVVIIFPRWREQNHKTSPWLALIDKLEEIGYTTKSDLILYSREQAVVQREIWQFVYNGK